MLYNMYCGWEIPNTNLSVTSHTLLTLNKEKKMTNKDLAVEVNELHNLDSKILLMKKKLKVLVDDRLAKEQNIVKKCKLHPEGETILYPKRHPLIKASTRATPVLDRDIAVSLIKKGAELSSLIKMSITAKDAQLFEDGVSYKYSKVSLTTI